jgi:hypothetical protein
LGDRKPAQDKGGKGMRHLETAAAIITPLL